MLFGGGGLSYGNIFMHGSVGDLSRLAKERGNSEYIRVYAPEREQILLH